MREIALAPPRPRLRSQRWRSQQLSPQRLLLICLALTAAVGLGFLVIWIAASPPASDADDIAGLLAVSALVSLGAYLLLLRALPLRPFGGVGGRVMLAVLFGGLLALVNVLITAGFMFLSNHDLVLLTGLLTFSLLVSSVLAVNLAASITGPVAELREALEGVDLAGAPALVPAAGEDEIARLGDAFNAMVERVRRAHADRDRAEASRRDLVAAISHDLRTPLASARLMIEAISDGVLSAEVEHRYVERTAAELRTLDRLIEDLFELSRLEAGALSLEKAATDVQILMAESVESMRPEADQAGVELRLSVAPELPLIYVDPLAIQRALRNLLANAIRYSPERETVSARASNDGAWVELTVSDEGPGVPAAEAARIFEPFFRGDRARLRNGAGAGLGLAIARGIAEAHGGALVLDAPSNHSAPDRGTAAGSGATFHLRVPAGSLRIPPGPGADPFTQRPTFDRPTPHPR